MNHHETDDWKKISHDEYEKRVQLERQLARTTEALAIAKQSLKASNNYSQMLEKQLAVYQENYNIQRDKLARSLDLLKNAKLLLAQRKKDLTILSNNNAKLTLDLTQRTAQLDAEMQQHAHTNYKLAQTLSKLTAITATIPNLPAIPPPARTITITSPDVIYAEASEEHQTKPGKKNGLLDRLFALEDEELVVNKNPPTQFMDQVLYIDGFYSAEP